MQNWRNKGTRFEGEWWSGKVFGFSFAGIDIVDYIKARYLSYFTTVVLITLDIDHLLPAFIFWRFRLSFAISFFPSPRTLRFSQVFIVLFHHFLVFYSIFSVFIAILLFFLVGKVSPQARSVGGNFGRSQLGPGLHYFWFRSFEKQHKCIERRTGFSLGLPFCCFFLLLNFFLFIGVEFFCKWFPSFAREGAIVLIYFCFIFILIILIIFGVWYWQWELFRSAFRRS